MGWKRTKLYAAQEQCCAVTACSFHQMLSPSKKQSNVKIPKKKKSDWKWEYEIRKRNCDRKEKEKEVGGVGDWWMSWRSVWGSEVWLCNSDWSFLSFSLNLSWWCLQNCNQFKTWSDVYVPRCTVYVIEEYGNSIKIT